MAGLPAEMTYELEARIARIKANPKVQKRAAEIRERRKTNQPKATLTTAEADKICEAFAR